MAVDGLTLFGQAVADLDAGRPVQVDALRARLVHESDQLQALTARAGEQCGGELVEACRRMADLLQRLSAAAVHVERGDAAAAGEAMREAMTASFSGGQGTQR